MKQEIKYYCSNCDEEGTRSEMIDHCREKDHGWMSDEIHETIKDGIWKMGTVGVDSGCIMIGDPCYQMENHPEFEAVQNWQSGFCKIMSENGHNPTQIGLSVATSTYMGDGEFIVYGKFKGGRPLWVKVDFTTRCDKYPNPPVTRTQIDIEKTKKAKAQKHGGSVVWKTLKN